MALEEIINDSLIVDDLKPDADSDFKWKVTSYSKVWRYLLNSNITSIVKHSSINKPIDSDDVTKLLFEIVEEGKGIELLNTIQEVFKEDLAVNKDSLVYAITVCTYSEKLDVKNKAYSLLNEICCHSAQFLQFIYFHEKICKLKRNTTGWSRGHRKAIQLWYCTKSPIEMAKIVTRCQRRNNWTHKDVLRLSHVKPSTEGHKVLTSFISTGLKGTKEKFKTETSKNDDSKENNEVLEYLEKVTQIKTSKEGVKVVPLVEELKLPWEFIPCQLHKDTELWKGLISYLPLDALISNICTLAKLKIMEDGSQQRKEFLRKCKDPAAVKDSHLHPYSILVQREIYSNAMNDANKKVSWTVDNHIVEGLNKAFELSIRNLIPSGKRYFITIDASSSMKAHIINNNHIQCRVVAACMALCIARVEQKAIVKAFTKELAEIKIDKNTKLEDIVKCLEDTPLGGTDCSRPIILAKSKKIKTDVFIVFTDKETWSGKTSPREALCQYRKALKIPAKLIVIALNTEGTAEKVVADPEDRGMMDIFGFSPPMTKIIHNFACYNF